jgi:hypothetical protein
MCLTEHHAVKTHGEEKVQRHAFLTSELDGAKLVSRLGRYVSGEIAASTHWTGLIRSRDDLISRIKTNILPPAIT